VTISSSLTGPAAALVYGPANYWRAAIVTMLRLMTVYAVLAYSQRHWKSPKTRAPWECWGSWSATTNSKVYLELQTCIIYLGRQPVNVDSCVTRSFLDSDLGADQVDSACTSSTHPLQLPLLEPRSGVVIHEWDWRVFKPGACTKLVTGSPAQSCFLYLRNIWHCIDGLSWGLIMGPRHDFHLHQRQRRLHG
jgi:hypothetical protein